MFSLLADLQKERGFPHPSRKKQLLKFKRESTCSPFGLDSGVDGRLSFQIRIKWWVTCQFMRRDKS
jgi:hypothetical protein